MLALHLPLREELHPAGGPVGGRRSPADHPAHHVPEGTHSSMATGDLDPLDGVGADGRTAGRRGRHGRPRRLRRRARTAVGHFPTFSFLLESCGSLSFLLESCGPLHHLVLAGGPDCLLRVLASDLKSWCERISHEMEADGYHVEEVRAWPVQTLGKIFQPDPALSVRKEAFPLAIVPQDPGHRLAELPF